MRIHIGNLKWGTTAADLRELFAPYGKISIAEVKVESKTNRPRGFGFVEMPIKSEALKAITALHGQYVNDRELRVEPARPPRASRSKRARTLAGVEE